MKKCLSNERNDSSKSSPLTPNQFSSGYAQQEKDLKMAQQYGSVHEYAQTNTIQIRVLNFKTAISE